MIKVHCDRRGCDQSIASYSTLSDYWPKLKSGSQELHFCSYLCIVQHLLETLSSYDADTVARLDAIGLALDSAVHSADRVKNQVPKTITFTA